MLESIEAGVLVIAPDGRVLSQNRAAAGVLEGRIEHVTELLGPLGWSPSPETRATTELQVLHLPDRWLELTRYVADGTDGAAPGTEVIIIRDVTRARQSQGLREAFMGLLSHELRTPVTSIYVAADLLRGRLDGAAENGALVDDISEEAERLLRLVDDLLVLAHFDEGIELVQEPSLLQRVVPVVVERERRRWPGIEIELQVGGDLPVVTGVETSVQQVVRNLLSNAAKYGLGAPIVVELRRSQDEPGAIVSVLDRGPGVAPAEGDALFRPFFRSARTARASSGAGIGLFVCRRLVEAMGGRMWARPRPGGGSEFGFWLPEYDHRPDDGVDPSVDGARPVTTASSLS